ncbi:MAG: tetratricopeptide repeat protein [Fibrobacteraceae bacterium]|nr:tetratricopeptide repeat protein [Fibrobacteraceae bacterium]
MAVTLESLKKIIGKKKKSRLFVWLADLERGAGNLDAAMQILDSGLREYPDMLQAHLIRSVILLEQGNLDAALEACDMILQMQPTCLSALRRKGEIYEKQGDEVSRNKYYRLVHDIDPLDMFWKEEYAVLPVEEPAVEETEESLFLPEDDSSEGFLLMPEEEQAADEDPFQIFNALGQEDAVEEDSLSEALENSLNDALEQVDLQDSAAQDIPLSIDDEAMSGSDVSSAISDFFGSADDDFFEEESLEESKPASPFSRLEIPESLEDPEPAEEVQQNFESSFEKSAEVVPEESVELDSAFDSLLGEDELPEESPSAFEKSAESASEEVGLDTAFDSLLGEDELPEESPSAFEKSAESVSEEVGLDTAFDSLLGEDELPEEAPSAFEKSAESVSEEVAVDLPEDSLAMDLDEEPTESLSDLLGNTEVKDESGVANAFDTLFGKEELVDDDELTLPEAKSVEPEIQTSAVEKREVPSELSAEVSSSLDALFGDDDDDLELPSLSTETQVAQDDASEKGAFDTLFNAAEDEEEDLSLGQDKVDFLMSGDSEDEVASALLKDAQASLEDNGENIDEHLNTATLAEIYFEQGLLQKSLDIYQDLHEKNPEDEQIANRLSEVQKACDEKFGNREN